MMTWALRPHGVRTRGKKWKLLSVQPLQLVAYLPMLSCLRPTGQVDPTHFTVNGFVQVVALEQWLP